MELLDAFSIFDPHTLPSGEEELACYGQEKLDAFLAAFGEGSDANVDGEECTSGKILRANPQLLIYDNVANVYKTPLY